VVIFNAIFPVLAIATLGYIWRKTREKSRKTVDVTWLVDIILYLTSPALVFSVIIKADFTWKSFVLVFSSAFFVVLLGLVLVEIIFKRLLRHRQQGAALPIIFINSGNLGLSVSYFAFGEAGLSIAVIFHTAMVVLVYSLGIFLLTKEDHAAKVFHIPHIYVCVLALGLNYYHIPVPLALARTLELLGQVTIPFMLFLLGTQLANTHFGRSWRLAITGATLRLTAGLLGGALFIKLFNVQGDTARVMIFLATLPGAIVTQHLTSKYHKNPELCSSIIAVSTLLGLVTIPGMLFLVTR